MKKITWNIQYLSTPPAIRYCKKCGKKSEYISSGLFRVNAQRKYLDIWLIYKCKACDSTWNMTIHSRINPKSIDPEILEEFHSNNEELAGKYAMDAELIRRNGAEAGIPKYRILGPAIDGSETVELHIKSPYPFRLKIASLIREKMNLSQNAFEKLVDSGFIRGASKIDFKKYRLQAEAVLIIDRIVTANQDLSTLAL